MCNSVYKATTKVPIYETKFAVVLCDDLLEGCEVLKDWFDIDKLNIDPTYSAAITMHGDEKLAIVFIRNSISPNVIAHEIYHVTSHIMNFVGVKYDITNLEAFCYLNGWITNWIYSKIYNKNKELK